MAPTKRSAQMRQTILIGLIVAALSIAGALLATFAGHSEDVAQPSVVVMDPTKLTLEASDMPTVQVQAPF
jgi:hypothetical protein